MFGTGRGMTSHRLHLPRVPIGASSVAAEVDLVYATYGTPAPDGRNCVVLPTYYTGTHESYLPWIGPGRPLDTERWYVVVPDMIGNGLSTIRHATTGDAWDPRTDPAVRIRDNVSVQRLLLRRLGVRHVALVAGWSMGGLQAYQWALSYPDLVGAILPICSSSRCWPLNEMFLEGLAPYLEYALDHPEASEWALGGFARAYAGWAYSAAYFRDELWRDDGYSSLDDLRESWVKDHLTWDPADLLTMLRTWADAGLDEPWSRALERITARAILMPSTSDMYFTLAENELEAAHLPSTELRPIVSDHGHIAGRPGHLQGVSEQIARAMSDLLSEPGRS